MTKEEKIKIEEYLNKEKLKVESKIEELKELTKPIEPDCAIGRVSRMDAINNRSISEAALQKANEKLKKINISLSNISDEGFGKCIHCGQVIPIQRLLLMPGSLCVKCAQRH
ncbi:MAG: TraR/DksA family transcriptional regulator [Marinilabiliales bacterium]|nr:MAG: TraR/DksA family transcriptional regulator [Marinilabiliales bacterium]